MLKRNWALIALIYLAFAEVLSWSPVPDLSLCLIQPSHDQKAADHNDEKYCPAFRTGVIVGLNALDGFLERHDKSVVGAFTIVLAISTIGLWLATNNLWRAGEKQIEFTGDSVAITYAELAKLKKHGFKDETEAGITMKLKRGTFSATFFMACVAALELEEVVLDEL
jgi:Domain of unknown function (DUF6471)